MLLRIVSLVISSLLLVEAAFASGIAFDCDVPSDRFSMITSKFDKSTKVSSTVKLIESRSGTFLPVANIRIKSLSDKRGFGFQLARATDNGVFDVIVSSSNGKKTSKSTIGQLSLKNPIKFSVELFSTGLIKLIVSEKYYDVEIGQIEKGTVDISCSTGEFLFSDLKF